MKIKTLLSVFFAAAVLLTAAVTAAAVDAPDLKFVPQKGKYIYCNNREFITRADLADDSNENACFIMNNDAMTPDRYALFVSHVNHTDVRSADDTQIIEEGFDIETDVMFRAVEDTTIRITALGFEVPENIKYYLDGKLYTDERPWGCFGAWADYLGVPVSEIDSGNRYEPVGFEPVEFKIKAGEIKWLSQYISNYREVPYYRPVHIVADFEILSGKSDVNVLALKATGTLRDRSRLSGNLRPGPYIYEHQHKGVADTLNRMDAELAYTIDDTVPSGEVLPINIYNQYVPEGNTAWMWVTHINPRADFWSKKNGDETGMVKLSYNDPKKNIYYGKNVPAEERDTVWHFDTAHSDVPVYPGADTGYTKGNYIPNFEMKPTDKDEYACSLGNFGVFMNYHLTVTNNGNYDRWFNYKLNTTSSNLIILRDENGDIVSPYPICKGYHDKKEEDILASVELPAHETKKFTLTVVLTTNYLGGMENYFIIADQPSPVKTYSPSWTLKPQDNSYTGKEYIKWDNGELYTSDGSYWKKVDMNAETKKKFSGHWNEYKILWTGNGYVAKNTLYDGIPYYVVRDFFREVYFLDENFNLTGTYMFGAYPTDMAAGNKGVFVKAGSKLYSADGKNWSKPAFDGDFPVNNYTKYTLSAKDGRLYVSEDDETYYRLVTDKEIALPVSVEHGYYVSADKKLYSADGIYWYEKQMTYEDTAVISGNDILELHAKDGMLPLRRLAGLLGWEIDYRNGAVTLLAEDNIVILYTQRTLAQVNGASVGLEKTIEIIDGVSYMHLDDVNDVFGTELEIR